MPRSIPLRSLVQTLDRQDKHDSASLAEVLARAVGVEELATFARFQVERYQRVCLHRSDDYEIRLLCWLPDQSSALHEHGPSACAFRVLMGTATESRLQGPDRVYGPGEVALDAESGVHQVANLGQAPLVTLHVYAPPLPVDQPSGPHGKRIAIVGGGLAGVALAIQLLESQEPDLRITLIQRAPRLGPPDSGDDNHLLELPAEQVSLERGRPDDFVEFAQCAGHALMPRSTYARYVNERLRSAIARSPGKIRLARDEAVDLQPLVEGWRVVLGSGRTLLSDHVVLATGAAGPQIPEGLQGDPRLVLDPLAPGGLDRVLLHERVWVVGTGMEALDVLVSLRARGHLGPVTAVSRTGRWPRSHLPRVTWRGQRPELHTASAPRTADGLAAWVRGHVDAASSRGIPWQAVIDEVQAHASELWARLPLQERGQLLEKYRRSWEVLRRRAPIDSKELLRMWKDEGWLRCLAGPLQIPAEADKILLCAGPRTDVGADPLWARLLSRGQVVADPLGLGVQKCARHLWVLGGVHGQMCAPTVAELTAQARELALTLITTGLPFPRLVSKNHDPRRV